MPLIHRFHSEYSPQAVKNIIHATLKRYTIYVEADRHNRMFYRMKKTRFYFHCFTEGSIEHWYPYKRRVPYHGTCFFGKIRPMENGCEITGSFYLMPELIIEWLIIGIIGTLFVLHDRGTSLEMIHYIIFGCIYLISVITALPDPALEEYVLAYIEKNLLGPTKPEQNQPSS